jgi:hypothetical protein
MNIIKHFLHDLNSEGVTVDLVECRDFLEHVVTSQRGLIVMSSPTSFTASVGETGYGYSKVRLSYHFYI